MGKLLVKYQTLQQALETFNDAIILLTQAQKNHSDEKIVLAFQDSLIQRFEYCIV